MKILKRLDIEAIGVDISDTLIDFGVISLFSFHGLLKNLELKLKRLREDEDIKINYYLPFYRVMENNSNRVFKGSDLKADGYIDIFKGIFKGTVLFEIETDNPDFLDEDIALLLKKMRLAGGHIYKSNIKTVENDWERVSGFYPVIQQNQQNQDLLDIVLTTTTYYNKGVYNVLRIGELVLTDTNLKGRFGYNLSVTTPIMGLVEFKRQKQEVGELFKHNKLSVIRENDEIKLQQGELHNE